jgi:hypothetical protein
MRIPILIVKKPDPDPHQSKNSYTDSNPNLHQCEKLGPDPHPVEKPDPQRWFEQK